MTREEAIQVLQTALTSPLIYGEYADAISMAIEALEDRPTGKWIKSDILPNGWHCSHCDSPVMTDDIDEMLFCPHCGTEMGGESDG